MIVQTSVAEIGQHGYVNPTPDVHDLRLIPQSIADGWEGQCSCGEWRAFISFYEIASRDDLVGEIERLHADHVKRLSEG